MVSVIIPTYNREATIEKAINSVLNQTYVDLEVLVIDDGSTDNTREVVFNIKDSRIRYYYQENQCACVARNLGIEMAKGEYIAFHDSDDLCRKERIERQINFLKSNGGDLAFCAFQKHGDKVEEKVPNTEAGLKKFEEILFGMYVSTQTIMGKKKVFETYKFDPKMKRLQDYDIMIRIAQTEKVFYQDEILVDVFLQKDSITRRQRGYNMAEIFCVKYPEIAEKYPKWRALLLSKTAKERTLMGEDSSEMFREICRIEPSIKNSIKYILAKLHILHFIFENRKIN